MRGAPTHYCSILCRDNRDFSTPQVPRLVCSEADLSNGHVSNDSPAPRRIGQLKLQHPDVLLYGSQEARAFATERHSAKLCEPRLTKRLCVRVAIPRDQDGCCQVNFSDGQRASVAQVHARAADAAFHSSIAEVRKRRMVYREIR